MVLWGCIVKESIVADKSKAFSLRIIKLYQYLRAEKKEYVMANQVLASGTSIGANIREALHAQSRQDFFAKMYISYKEANETAYWLELLHESEYIEEEAFESIYEDCKEIIKMLTAITKASKISKRESI